MSVNIKVHFSITGEIQINVHDDHLEHDFETGSDKSERIADKIAREHIDRKLKSKGIDAFEIAYTVKSKIDDDADQINQVEDKEPPF